MIFPLIKPPNSVNRKYCWSLSQCVRKVCGPHYRWRWRQPQRASKVTIILELHQFGTPSQLSSSKTGASQWTHGLLATVCQQSYIHTNAHNVSKAFSIAVAITVGQYEAANSTWNAIDICDCGAHTCAATHQCIGAHRKPTDDCMWIPIVDWHFSHDR